ncbi:hypothetical protein PS718_05101 [Pseudomonas fluorescens]|uniref:Uncharacterized protein n=1 Tax=Pseudomonas fluorescens TaxID=294 RepID=A0A5E7F008_PSEFL|nr:hypothetical protein PS718_05101 [Pseudomonas fluorescens]
MSEGRGFVGKNDLRGQKCRLTCKISLDIFTPRMAPGGLTKSDIHASKGP